jgi:HSP20 family protein
MGSMSVRNREAEGLGGPGDVLGPLRVMRRLLGLDPFQEMAPFQTFEQGTFAFVPAFEVKETPDAYEFRADVPGVAEGDIEVTVTGNRLTISGKREAETVNQSDKYFATERTYGTFVRSFTLPEGVNAEEVQATLTSGVLSVTVPKRPETQPKKIAVKPSSIPSQPVQPRMQGTQGSQSTPSQGSRPGQPAQTMQASPASPPGAASSAARAR